MRFLARLFLNGAAIIVAAYVVPGIVIDGPAPALAAGVILGFVNALIRPVLFVLTLPLTLLTLGLLVFVLNAVCLGLTAAAVPGFAISGVTTALAGALVVTVVSGLLNRMLVGKKDA